MDFYLLFLLSSFVFLNGGGLLALAWALRSGELRDPAQRALLVFDEEEPVGVTTDGFPGATPPPEGESPPIKR